MEGKVERQNDEYIRLFKKYEGLVSIASKRQDPFLDVFIGLAIPVFIFVIEEKVFHIKIPKDLIAAGIATGGATAAIHVLVKKYKLYKTENRLLQIANENYHSDMDADLNPIFYNRFNPNDREAYIRAYYNYLLLNYTDNSPVKKLKNNRRL